jgi:hypothetical protein
MPFAFRTARSSRLIPTANYMACGVELLTKTRAVMRPKLLSQLLHEGSYPLADGRGWYAQLTIDAVILSVRS